MRSSVPAWQLKEDPDTTPVRSGQWREPSVLHRLAPATMNVGTGKDRRVVEEGNLAPYLEVTYLP